MKILALFLVFSVCTLGVATHTFAQSSDSQGSYNIRSNDTQTERTRTKSLYSSKAARSSTSRSSSGSSIYSSKQSSGSSGSQPLSISNILSGNYKPKRVIQGFNDRSDTAIPYGSQQARTRSSISYTTEEITQMRKDRIKQNAETLKRSQETYEQRVARRMEELKERERMLSERSLQNITSRVSGGGSQVRSAASNSQIVQDEDDGPRRRQVYRGLQQEDNTSDRLFNSVR